MSNSDEGFAKMVGQVNKWALEYPGLAKCILTSKFNLIVIYFFLVHLVMSSLLACVLRRSCWWGHIGINLGHFSTGEEFGATQSSQDSRETVAGN